MLFRSELMPECNFERGCMSCGHCVAICPVSALDNKYVPLNEQPLITEPILDANVAYNFLRMRRSIRTFKNKIPTKDDILNLLEVCRYAPSAGNSQGIYYKVISDKEKIKQIADATATWMQLEIETGSKNSRYYKSFLNTYNERKIDIIARETPMLIFAMVKRLNTTGVSNAEQAFAYAELYAPTIGLGTTIAGFIQACAISGYKPLIELLGISEKQRAVGTLMVGYPKYKYKRLIERQHLKVEFE